MSNFFPNTNTQPFFNTFGAPAFNGPASWTPGFNTPFGLGFNQPFGGFQNNWNGGNWNPGFNGPTNWTPGFNTPFGFGFNQPFGGFQNNWNGGGWNPGFNGQNTQNLAGAQGFFGFQNAGQRFNAENANGGFQNVPNGFQNNGQGCFGFTGAPKFNSDAA